MRGRVETGPRCPVEANTSIFVGSKQMSVGREGMCERGCVVALQFELWEAHTEGAATRLQSI